MKTKFFCSFIICKLLFLSMFIGAETESLETNNIYYHIKADLQSISSLYPRIENSANEKKLLAYIRKEIENIEGPADISIVEHDLQTADYYHSFSSILEVIIKNPAAENEQDDIFFLFPINHPEDSPPETDRRYNIAAGLAAARSLTKNPGMITTRLLFVGAEYGPSPIYPLGSREFLERYYPGGNTAFFYFDLTYPTKSLFLETAGTETAVPYWLLKQTTTVLESENIPFTIHGNRHLIYSLGLNDGPLPIDVFLQNQYPAVMIKSNHSIPAEQKETDPLSFIAPEDFIGLLERFITEVARTQGPPLPQKWEQHYLLFAGGPFFILLPEIYHILFLFFSLSLILAIPFLLPYRISKYIRILKHSFYFFTLPLLYAIMFLTLWISTWILQTIISYQQIPDLWQYEPLLFLVLKITASSLFFFLISRFFNYMHFSKRGSFYTASALFFLIITIIVLVMIDISLVYYVVWIFICTFLFSFFKRRRIKIILLTAGALPLIIALIDIFMLQALEPIRIILLSPIYGNLLIALHLLPFILMALRLRFLYHPAERVRNLYILLITDLVLLITVTGLIIYLSIFTPFHQDRPQPITLHDSISTDIDNTHTREITISSPAPIGSIEIKEQNTLLMQIDTEEKEYSFSAPVTEDLITLHSEELYFLGRKNISIDIYSQYHIQEVLMDLIGKEEIVLHETQFPVIFKDPLNQEASLRIGRNPKIPFSASLTIPKEHFIEFHISAILDSDATALTIHGGLFSVDKKVVHKKYLAYQP